MKNKKSLIFIVAYGIYITSLIFEFTSFQVTFDKGLQILRYISYALFVTKIFWQLNYEKRTIILFPLLLLTVIYQSTIGGGKELCFLVIILLSSIEIDKFQIMKCHAVVGLLNVIVIFLLCSIGILENYKFLDHNTIRYAIGFRYVTLPGEVFLSCILAWYCYRQRKITIKEILIFCMGFCGIFYFTDSKTTLLLGIGTSLVMIGLKYYNKVMISNWITFFVYQMFPIYMVFATIIIQIYYKYHKETIMMVKLNQVLNGRLQLSLNAIREFGINIIGHNIKWIDNTAILSRNHYNYVDNSYLKIVLDYGLFVAIIVLVFYLFTMYMFIQKGNRIGCILLCAVLVYGFISPVLISIILNPFVVLFGGIFENKRKIN